jgi:DNA polymerase I-like protein with 3'-5' exonuclease and polymerase domains
MIVSLDIETKCNVSGCPGTIDKCDHALNPHYSDISCIGLWTPEPNPGNVFRNLGEFKSWLIGHPEAKFVGHNLKFDIKHLRAKGINISSAQYAEDTQIMSAVSLTKVSPEYMAWYSAAREKKNKEIGRTGGTHRAARGNSLKVLAPYFLKVEPFWENPKDHDSDEYVLKDCEYTYRLYEFFQAKLKEEGLTEFYQQLMSWTRMLTEAEIKGIKIDMDLVASKHSEASQKAVELEVKLASEWAAHLIAYNQLQKDKIRDKYHLMYQAAKTKRRAKKQSIDEIAEMELHLKYKKMREKAEAKDIEPFNFASPTQLKWLFKERLGLDITNFKDEESTGKEVLNRLTSEGHGDVALFLEYRKYSKLNTAFYPSYKEMQFDNTIHCNFNPTGTRTGRLSSSGPNLQQVPGDLHQLFIARPGYKLITRDLSAIEPCLVAYYTQDPILCDLLIKGEHFHTQNAKVMFDLDRTLTKAQVKEQFPRELAVAKTVGLAVIYGAGPFRVQQTGMQQGFNWHIGFCKEAVERLKYEYQTAFEFKQGLDNYAVDHPIETLFGRKHRYEDPSEIYMKAFNTLIQSTASDLLLAASYRAQETMKLNNWDCYALLWVHDEIVFECKEEKAIEAAGLIDFHLTSKLLPTPYGQIPLKVEGKISDKWEK